MKKIMDATLLWLFLLLVISCATVKQAEEPVSVTASPTEVGAEAGNGRVTIRWNGVAGAESYSIYMSGSEGTSKKNFDGRRSTTATSYSWAGLTNGTSYYFVVTALKKDKESSDSKEVTGTPKAPVAAPKPKEPPKAAEPAPKAPEAVAKPPREARRPPNQRRRPLRQSRNPRERPRRPPNRRRRPLRQSRNLRRKPRRPPNQRRRPLMQSRNLRRKPRRLPNQRRRPLRQSRNLRRKPRRLPNQRRK